jgi:hypothetical protein
MADRNRAAELYVAQSFEATATTPERKLILSILVRAFMDSQGTAISVSKETRREARFWLEDESMRLWGYFWCCQQLDLDPYGIRGAIFGRTDWEFRDVTLA